MEGPPRGVEKLKQKSLLVACVQSFRLSIFIHFTFPLTTSHPLSSLGPENTTLSLKVRTFSLLHFTLNHPLLTFLHPYALKLPLYYKSKVTSLYSLINLFWATMDNSWFCIFQELKDQGIAWSQKMVLQCHQSQKKQILKYQ